MTLPTTFLDFLNLIGSPVFLGVVLSLLATRWQWFNDQSNSVKFWLTGLICVILPVLSQVGITYIPANVMTIIGQWWPTVMIGVGAWVSSQAWYIIFGPKAVAARQGKMQQ